MRPEQYIKTNIIIYFLGFLSDFAHLEKSCSHTNPSAKHSEASVLTVADLADLFTKDTEDLEWSTLDSVQTLVYFKFFIVYRIKL